MLKGNRAGSAWNGVVLPDKLPKREPGEELAKLDELDQLRGRAEVAEAELVIALKDVARLTEDLAATVAECDDLSVRSLPWLDTPTWPQTGRPVGAVIAGQMDAEQAAKGLTGWN